MTKEKPKSEYGKMKEYWGDIFFEGKKVEMSLSLVLPGKEVSTSGKVVVISGVEIDATKFCIFKYGPVFYLGKFDSRKNNVTIVAEKMEKAIYKVLLNAPKDDEEKVTLN
jgi:hypothetical protein